MPTLVLWDVDQTLIDGGGVTQRAYAAAFHTTTGRSLTEPWQFDGRTELAAVTDVLRLHGLEPDRELVDAFTEQIVVELRNRADDLAANGRVLPGAAAALAAVGGSPAVDQSVLTGNLYPLAVLKLELFGLAHHVDFRIGAYGGDALDRTDLPTHALQRSARVLGRRYTGADTVIVGDTLRDIAAARAIGARAVAVATGPYGAQDLQEAGADVVLADLTDTAAVVQAITAPS
jgi:phosphoglycolate phosphatase-like HAD superfamily hydrolase